MEEPDPHELFTIADDFCEEALDFHFNLPEHGNDAPNFPGTSREPLPAPNWETLHLCSFATTEMLIAGEASERRHRLQSSLTFLCESVDFAVQN